MKNILKKASFMFLVVPLVIACFSACSGGSVSTTKELPQEISQEDWNDARQYIDLSTGLKMSYVEMGNPDGPVMILQHGTTDNSRIWSLAAPYFCEAGYHLYITDLRGQGCSSQPDGFYTITDYANDIKAFMDAKNIDKAIMVGQSLGSFTMQAFMLMYPERCEKVVLVASGYADERYTASGSNGYAYLSTLADDEYLSDEFIENWYTNECEVPEEFMNYIKKESQALPAKVWKNIFGGAATSYLADMYQYFDSSIPTLIMHGEKDTMLDEEHQTKLKEALPFADYIAYEGVGHNIHIEIPEQFAKDVIDWLQK